MLACLLFLLTFMAYRTSALLRQGNKKWALVSFTVLRVPRVVMATGIIYRYSKPITVLQSLSGKLLCAIYSLNRNGVNMLLTVITVGPVVITAPI